METPKVIHAIDRLRDKVIRTQLDPADKQKLTDEIRKIRSAVLNELTLNKSPNLKRMNTHSKKDIEFLSSSSDFSEFIKNLQMVKDLSNIELGQLLGYTGQAVWSWKTGRLPRVSEREKICYDLESKLKIPKELSHRFLSV